MTGPPREGFTREFIVLSALGAFAIFSSTMSKAPTLSLFAKYLGATPLEIGFIAAASTVVGIVTNVTAGTLSDLYGRKTLIITATIIFATAPFLYLLVTTPIQLLLVRLYHGFATATLAPVLSATIADMYLSRRGEMMSLATSSQYVGRLLAPTVGGLILSPTLLGLTLPGFHKVYLVCGVSGSLALILALSLFLFPALRASSATSKRGGVVENLRQMPRHTGFMSISSALSALYLSVGPIETFLPLYAEGLGIPSYQIGLLLSIQNAMILLAGPIFGRLSDRLSRSNFVMTGVGIVALSIVLISFSGSFPVLLLVMLLYGSGMAMTLATTPPMVAQVVPRPLYGTSLGALETIKDIGQTLGPIVVGLAVGLSGGEYFGAFILLGGIIAANLGFLNIGLRRRYHQVRPDLDPP
ncbi:MFS transporter [Candidatus Bathyarchaeota archaeon]|jgi:MFS family permease|nr:MFS transporter [Candidatus Bathyarchaeota archaeon]